MSIDLNGMKQESLFVLSDYRTQVNIPKDHPLVVLNQSLDWQALMEQAIPLLYQKHGISIDIGRRLDLRAHLGAYILQSVHNWTDRWTEEMLRFYIPARIFCGFLESSGSLDHTKIEEFRNRLGTEGAQLITKEVVMIAKKFGFTQPDDVDMDTTVQEAGITHPTEMKLIDHLIKRAKAFHQKLKETGSRGICGIKKLAKTFSKVFTDYRFFAKTKETKSKAIKKSVKLAKKVLEKMSEARGSMKKLTNKAQAEYKQIQELGPKLMEQIMSWLETGKVATGKIISLWKTAPKAISKGKVGKSVEFGRKWVVNAYRGGYVLLLAPEKVKISDQHCVEHSLKLHFDTFDQSPTSYATDRGMWSEENVTHCLVAEVKAIGIQPKGKSSPLTSRRVHQELKNRRAGIEPRIAHLKTRGLGRSRMKSDMGDLISGYRSALSYNQNSFFYEFCPEGRARRISS